MIDFVLYWKEIVIGLLGLIIIIQAIILLKVRKGKNSELQPLINEIRSSLREHHLEQRKLFKEIDYVLAEIPSYINKKVKETVE